MAGGSTAQGDDLAIIDSDAESFDSQATIRAGSKRMRTDLTANADGDDNMIASGIDIQMIHSRLEQLESKVASHDVAIREINARSRLRNILFNCIVTKSMIDDPTYQVKPEMIKFINVNMLKGKEKITDIDVNACHPTAARLGPYVQIIMEFRTYDIAQKVKDGAINLASINESRRKAADEEEARRGVRREPLLMRVNWQLEKVANSMMSYLAECRMRVLTVNPTWDKKSVDVFKKKGSLDPEIKIRGQSYKVDNLPTHLLDIMGGPWHEGYIRVRTGRAMQKKKRAQVHRRRSGNADTPNKNGRVQDGSNNNDSHA